MSILTSGRRIVVGLAVLLEPLALLGQTSSICGEGNGTLNPAQPSGATPQQIIEKVAAKEAMFKQARNNYTYTQDISVQTLVGNTVTGEYRLVQDITYDDKGGPVEDVTLAPQSTW